MQRTFAERTGASVVVLLVLVLGGCSSSKEVPGRDLPASEVATVRARVAAATAGNHGRFGVFIDTASLRRAPRARDVFRRLGFIDAVRGDFTAAGVAAGKRLGSGFVYYPLVSARFASIRSVLIVPPGLGAAGSRMYVVDLRVTPLETRIARDLAAANALACRGLGGDLLPIQGAIVANVPAVFFTAYDPALPNAGQVRAGLSGQIRPDCVVLR